MFWKNHSKLRITLMVLFVIAGLALTVIGWTMTGKLAGLGLMILGVILLLTTLFLYNKPYQ